MYERVGVPPEGYGRGMRFVSQRIRLSTRAVSAWKCGDHILGLGYGVGVRSENTSFWRTKSATVAHLISACYGGQAGRDFGGHEMFMFRVLSGALVQDLLSEPHRFEKRFLGVEE